MLIDNIETVKEHVKVKGFHYTFNHYSHFLDVDDAVFHILRENYLEAVVALAEYIEIEA